MNDKANFKKAAQAEQDAINTIGRPAPEESKPTKTKKPKKPDGLWGNLRVLVEALLIAILIQTFLIQPRFVPSSSMKPTLLIRDYLITNKFAYGWSRWSCPFGACSFIENRVMGKSPERGDVVVFSNPGGPTGRENAPYVKRLVGLPGDTIQVKNGILYINDTEVPQVSLPHYQESLDDFLHETNCADLTEEACLIEQAIETLPNGVSHLVFNETNTGIVDNTPTWTVPEKHYFMMGDNRDNSNDSRLDVGFVPEDRLMARVEMILFSSSGSSLLQFWKWRRDRFFKRVE